MRISDWSSDVCSSDLPRSSARTASPGASSARPQSPASNSLVDVDRLANNGLTNSIHQGKNQGPGDALGLGLLQNIVGIALPGHPDIVDVAIHSVLSESAEDAVKATIVLSGDSKVTEAEMCSWRSDGQTFELQSI